MIRHFPDNIVKDTDLIEDEEIIKHMCKDLNTPATIGRMNALAKLGKKGDRDAVGRLAFGMNLLGFMGVTDER